MITKLFLSNINSSFTKCKSKYFINSLSAKKVTKFTFANFQKCVKSKLYHIENQKIRGQTV